MKKLFKKGAEFHDRSPVKFAWDPSGNLLASVGRNAVVHLFDRHGQHVHEISLSMSTKVLNMEWDKDGEVLAILQAKNNVILLYDVHSRQSIDFDSRLEEPSFLKWSQSSPLLAVAGAKGNLQIYNKDTRKTVPVWGKHPSKITCGAWSKGSNKLALGSDDCTLTLSNEDGDTQFQEETKYAPVEIRFAPGNSNLISINMSGHSLLLYNLADGTEAPVELAFQSGYGEIKTHHWFGDRYIMIGFSEGYLVVISTHMQEIGEEQHHKRLHSKLYDIAYSPALNRAATLGDGGVRIIDMTNYNELKNEGISMDTSRNSENMPHDIDWSPDGQILTVSTHSGVVYNFLAKMPCVHARNGLDVAYLCSLREVAVVNVGKYRSTTYTVPVSIEPTFMALGPEYLAVGMNNRVLYYQCSPHSNQMLAEKEYIGSVNAIDINGEYAAVLAGKNLFLETLPGVRGGDAGSRDGPRKRVFPDPDAPEQYRQVTCMALLEQFVIFGTESGSIHFFFLPDWTMISGAELRNDQAVSMLAPNHRGTRVIFVNDSHEGHLYNPVTGEVNEIPEFPPHPTKVLWDETDRHVFYIFSETEMHVYVYAPVTIKRQQVVKVGRVDIDGEGVYKVSPETYRVQAGFTPIVCNSEYITYQNPSGSLKKYPSPPYNSFDRNLDIDEPQRLRLRFRQCLCLHLLREAWDAALEIDQTKYYFALANKAMELMDIPMAMRVYRQLGDAGMVMALEQIVHLEDKNLIAGHMALFNSDYQTAQDLFLSSSEPVEALHMQRDLVQWEQALKLAMTLAPEQVPEITVQFAQQLEFKENYEEALRVYESADPSMSPTGASAIGALLSPENEKLVTHGLARCSLRLGDLHRGLRLARASDDAQLCRECADILEGEASDNYMAEAAALYEFGGFYEDAARIYLTNIRDLTKASKIMDRVNLLNLQAQYAQACEKTGKYEEAIVAYDRARDTDSIVRLYLHQLDQPASAFDLVRSSQSASGAELVARFCQKTGDVNGTIEFLLMANQSRAAFDYAKEQDALDVLSSSFGDDISARDAAQVAQYYEQKQNLGKAGHFYALCGMYGRALSLFLKCGDSEIDQAIEVVGKARDDMLTHELIDFLMGEKDGVPKDIKYIYTLQMALGNYQQAAETATVIARQEQDHGNYKEAHEIYYQTIRALEDKNYAMPRELRVGFQLLHSYLLIQKLLKTGDHEGAARNLLRVAHNISRFPKHDVNLLTLAVIECSRAGLKKSAYSFATKLVSPDFRSKLDPKYSRKIEKMVRRPSLEEKAEETSPCPISGRQIALFSLECPTTRDPLPMCIISGRHLEREDFCLCPVSQMPALYSQYIRYLTQQTSAMADAQSREDGKEDGKEPGGARGFGRGGGGRGVLEGVDPILGQSVRSDELRKLGGAEVDAYLARFNNTGGNSKAADAKAAASGGGEPMVPETV
mmetsp:Transcript_838/g.2234  ORF Transcript_838/g.2234 Transcript_838/m.2234 type:complete len:1438 (-) Transcript_838:93-4406(-)|eukprot:CAMPEP_0118862358 /NCGR_PEP_ID=MMETSP1163-20130328/7583_1 /TAXON_ID=124430 /ORGANISM="Phaeomonas parva, Strain CCMP2877" /LENGTH=1437 /DNA_ID=CAMNT_0006796253 /DNA_START=248 /DNA_END=4561 /DNA_ORIENTATION=+